MSHSKEIAKNTIFLYVRTLIIMFISIYTSRVLLEKLGVDDFGIYNLVGGIVVAFGSLKSVFAQSVQRFLNYEKGKGNIEKVADVFSISVYIHIVLGIIFGILVAIFGVLYIPNHLKLPIGTLSSAMFVFYCSVLTAVISIITIPYDSAIIANEKFDFYAIVSIFDVLARLGILYILWIGNNILKTYALLVMVVTILFRIIHILYAAKFPECRLKKVWNKTIFNDLAGFSWWNFLGNTAFSISNEGINFIINIFGGVTANAARGLAYQVKSAVSQLSSNVGIASRPHVSEAVAYKDQEVIFKYVTIVSSVMFLIVSLTVLPILVYTEQILKIWLTEIPQYTVIFVQIVLIDLVIRAPQTGIDILFSAYNKMRTYQIVQSILLFMSLPLAYLFLKLGKPVYWAFIAMCISEVVTLLGIVVCASKELGFSIIKYYNFFIRRALRLLIILIILGITFHSLVLPTNPWLVIIYSLPLVVIGGAVAYKWYLSNQERQIVKSFIYKKLARNKKIS